MLNKIATVPKIDSQSPQWKHEKVFHNAALLVLLMSILIFLSGLIWFFGLSFEEYDYLMKTINGLC